jgi:perosamine synthetase
MPFPLQTWDKRYFYVARIGIYHLIRSLQLEHCVVLAPDYHHGNEILAMKAAGAQIRYYPVQKNLDVRLDALGTLCEMKPKPRALYITHFIGWPQPLPEIQRLCRANGLLLIEDCALSFMSEFDGAPLGAFGDYSVFCLYKSLPLPNGGVLVGDFESGGNPDELHRCSAASLTSRSAELMLQWLRMRYETTGRALFALKRAAGRALNAGRVRRAPVGNTGFDLSEVNLGMSPICQKLLRRFPYGRIKETRRRNFRILEDRLHGKISLLEKDLADGVCPLFFPLLVKNKHSASAALLQRGIETVEFWNEGDPEACRDGSAAQFLRRHLLEIPIHQDVSADDAAFTADEILKLNLGL